MFIDHEIDLNYNLIWNLDWCLLQLLLTAGKLWTVCYRFHVQFGEKLYRKASVFWLLQITAFVLVTNIAVTGGDNSKESSVHFFLKLWRSLPIYCHNFTHRARTRAGPLSRDCQSHKNPDNQGWDHQGLMLSSFSLRIVPIISMSGRPHNLAETCSTLTSDSPLHLNRRLGLIFWQPLPSNRLNSLDI